MAFQTFATPTRSGSTCASKERAAYHPRRHQDSLITEVQYRYPRNSVEHQDLLINDLVKQIDEVDKLIHETTSTGDELDRRYIEIYTLNRKLRQLLHQTT